jgi:hypothetical protein
MKYWKIIADNLSKAGWSLGWVSAIDSNGQTQLARSWDFNREMLGRESPEKIPRVEDFGRRADSLSLEAAIKDVPGSFDNNRRRDRVNVTSAGDGSAFAIAMTCDNVHQKNLCGTPGLIRGLWPRCVWISQIANGREVKVCADLGHAQVARHRDEIHGGKFADDVLSAERGRKFPRRSWYLVSRSAHFDSAFLENDAASGSALTGQTGSARWFPAIECKRNRNFVRFR